MRLVSYSLGLVSCLLGPKKTSPRSRSELYRRLPAGKRARRIQQRDQPYRCFLNVVF